MVVHMDPLGTLIKGRAAVFMRLLRGKTVMVLYSPCGCAGRGNTTTALQSPYGFMGFGAQYESLGHWRIECWGIVSILHHHILE